MTAGAAATQASRSLLGTGSVAGGSTDGGGGVQAAIAYGKVAKKNQIKYIAAM